MPIKLDFSKFKHIKSDNNSTVLKHQKDGHTITLVHKSLSPENQKQLSALSGIAKESETSTDESDIQKQKLAEGGDVYPPCMNPNCKSNGESHPNCKCYGGMAKGGKVKHYCSINKQHNPDCMYYNGGKVAKYADGSPDVNLNDVNADLGNGIQITDPDAVATNAGPPTDPMAPDTAPPAPAPDAEYKAYAAKKLAQTNMPEADTSPAPQPADNTANQDASQSDNSSEPATEPTEPKETSGSTSLEATPNDAAESDLNPQPTAADFVTKKQEVLNNIDKESKAWQQDLANGHISTPTYHSLFANKDTPGKFGTIFGLLLGGIGAGLTRGPNIALEMMNRTIQNDLESQKASKSNAFNYLNMITHNDLEQQRIKQQAPLTQAQAHLIKQQAIGKAYENTAYTLLQNEMNRINAMPPGDAKDKALTAIAMANQGIQASTASILDKIASGAAAGNLLYKTPVDSQLDNEAAFQKQIQNIQLLGTPQAQERAKYLLDRHVPGWPGLATEAVPEKARDELTAYKNVNNLINEAISIGKQGLVSKLNPALRARVPTLMNELAGSIRIAEQQGVYKKSEADMMMDTIGGSPAGFLAKLNSIPQLEELQKIKSSQYNSKAAQYGLKAPQLPTQNGMQQPQSGQPQIKIWKGVKYTRGPNGESVPVK